MTHGTSRPPSGDANAQHLLECEARYLLAKPLKWRREYLEAKPVQARRPQLEAEMKVQFDLARK